MLAHGRHLLDLARHLAGDLVAVQARYSDRHGMRSWFIAADFASGCLGQLELTIPIRMDWHEALHIYGERGSVIAKTHSPWYSRASDVEIFSEADGMYHRPLGADGHHYRRQMEGFADMILHGISQRGATTDDGVASVRAMVAVATSVRVGRVVRLDAAEGGV